MRTVEVEKITGSVGRYRDFDGAFLPLKKSMVARWGRIDRAYHRGDELPAVSLYKVGDRYFVRDGNHRVSVPATTGLRRSTPRSCRSGDKHAKTPRNLLRA
jgi:hypothetical protein